MVLLVLWLKIKLGNSECFNYQVKDLAPCLTETPSQLNKTGIARHPVYRDVRRWGIGAHALISQLAVALNQGVFEEIQVLRRQAKKPRVQASWFYWFYWPRPKDKHGLSYLLIKSLQERYILSAKIFIAGEHCQIIDIMKKFIWKAFRLKTY